QQRRSQSRGRHKSIFFSIHPGDRGTTSVNLLVRQFRHSSERLTSIECNPPSATITAAEQRRYRRRNKRNWLTATLSSLAGLAGNQSFPHSSAFLYFRSQP